ncbi:TagK domain-containing protein [Hafnia alvei]|uniref:TagK domain-containing protein n=1 Tax=Hafnia alvei TaxID=569 RepID=A0ABD7QBK4_HAFAL|nr:TagK domain-containing protein [Hafnia alvei]TBL70810.1 TagK domain-containing protein [Hafnia alvei]
MNIQFEWPMSGKLFPLPRDLTADKAAVFDVIKGAFSSLDSHTNQDVVAFYWHMARPVMINLCTNYVCNLDGAEVLYGAVQPLHEASEIQIGHFKLLMARSSGWESDASSLYRLINSNDENQMLDSIHDIEDLLPNCANYLNDIRYFNEVTLEQGRGDDILKTLEVEYKRFLIWQEQNGNMFNEWNQNNIHRIKVDHKFDMAREQAKNKTLTECIIDGGSLMEKIWSELEQGEQWNELFIQDEKPDLLRVLSPEHIVAKIKNNVPELIVHDQSKISLNSYY